jgi:hypothetical protein
MKRITLLALAFAVGACGASLTQAGAQVKLMKADPAPECAELGGVSGRALGGDADDTVKIKLRNEAGEKGANYVRLETLGAGTGSGTAYRCPEAVTQTARRGR